MVSVEKYHLCFVSEMFKQADVINIQPAVKLYIYHVTKQDYGALSILRKHPVFPSYRRHCIS